MTDTEWLGLGILVFTVVWSLFALWYNDGPYIPDYPDPKDPYKDEREWLIARAQQRLRSK